MRCSDDGMPEPPAARAYRKGTKVRSEVHRVSERRAAGSPLPRACTASRPLNGEVVGYDDDLLLPLIEWEDGSGPEACEADEFEVIA